MAWIIYLMAGSHFLQLGGLTTAKWPSADQSSRSSVALSRRSRERHTQKVALLKFRKRLDVKNIILLKYMQDYRH